MTHTIAVSVDDLRLLIARAQDAEYQLDQAVKADQRWRAREGGLTAEVAALRYAIGQALGLPDDEAQGMPTPDLVDRLLARPAAAVSTEDASEFDPQAAEVAQLSPPLETVIATTDNGRRFRVNVRDDGFFRAYWPNAELPHDVTLVWEAGTPERVWEINRDAPVDTCTLVGRPLVACSWVELLANAHGGHVVEVVEIEQAQLQEAGTGE